MTKLTCTVNDCIHNTPNMCCRPEIHVEGSCACDCEQTCCGSYRKEGESGVSNSRGTSSPNSMLHIRCAAENCIYNRSGECSAEAVSISPCGGTATDSASCTECASFRMR